MVKVLKTIPKKVDMDGNIAGINYRSRSNSAAISDMRHKARDGKAAAPIALAISSRCSISNIDLNHFPESFEGDLNHPISS